MKFLCRYHQERLQASLDDAHIYWRRALVRGRALKEAKDWNAAVVFFGNAFDIAEILFVGSPSSVSRCDYLQTAAELALVIERSDYTAKLENFISLVKMRVDNDAACQRVDVLVISNQEIIFRPISCEELGSDRQWQAELGSVYTVH